MRRDKRFAFALYEVLLGLAIFAIGVVALGRAVGNCLSASSIRADDARVREMLADRMAEVQTAPGAPDPRKETNFNSESGVVRVVQQAVPQQIKEANGVIIPGLHRVTLTANWSHGGAAQTKQIAFYVYRAR